jgi:hypothetical protein
MVERHHRGAMLDAELSALGRSWEESRIIWRLWEDDRRLKSLANFQDHLFSEQGFGLQPDGDRSRSNRDTMPAPGDARSCHHRARSIPPIMKRLRFVSIDALCQDRPLGLCQLRGQRGVRGHYVFEPIEP